MITHSSTVRSIAASCQRREPVRGLAGELRYCEGSRLHGSAKVGSEVASQLRPGPEGGDGDREAATRGPKLCVSRR